MKFLYVVHMDNAQCSLEWNLAQKRRKQMKNVKWVYKWKLTKITKITSGCHFAHNWRKGLFRQATFSSATSFNPHPLATYLWCSHRANFFNQVQPLAEGVWNKLKDILAGNTVIFGGKSKTNKLQWMEDWVYCCISHHLAGWAKTAEETENKQGEIMG